MRKIVFIAMLLFCFGCDSEDLSNLSDTIYVSNNGADMPIHIHGTLEQKAFIVVIHGGPGGNGLEYRPGKAMELLEAENAVVYWDQRGQGNSQGKYSSGDVSIEQMSRDLSAVIAVLKTKYGSDNKVFLMGHSWGGTLGTAFLLDRDRRESVDGWIEVDGAHDIPKLNKDAIVRFLDLAAEQIDLGNSTEKWQEIIDWASQIDTANITDMQSGEINSKGQEMEGVLSEDGVLAEGENGGSSVLRPINLLTSFFTGNSTSNKLNEEVEMAAYTSRLNEIDIPCLIQWGEYDMVVPKQLGLDAFSYLGTLQKEFKVYAKSAHSPMNNEPEAFANDVLEFIRAYR